MRSFGCLRDRLLPIAAALSLALLLGMPAARSRAQVATVRPDLPDLDVGFIHRDPSFPYDGTPNAPVAGQQVFFRAHIVNSGTQQAPPFRYQWLLDGNDAESGTYPDPVPPGGSVVVTYPMRWSYVPQDLTLRLEVTGPEISTDNDQLTIRTTAITLGFWIEQSAYDYFRANQWTYCQRFACGSSDSFEDWLQRQVSIWNDVLARSGVIDRIRVDEITVVPDGALPLDGGVATNSPDRGDHTVDLQWGLPSPASFDLSTYGPFGVEWSLIHELSHARYLTDIYRFDISAKAPIDVTAADGLPAYDAANPFDPSRPLRAFASDHNQYFLYQNQEQDLMSCTCDPYYSPYNVMVWNRIQGRRALCSNVNPPCNMGEWFLEMPLDNRLRIVDGSSPVPDGTVIRLFFDQGHTYNGHAFSDSDSETLTARDGEVALDPDPFHDATTSAAARADLLVEVRASRDEFCFLEPTYFNEAYWDGYVGRTQPATFTLHLGREIDNACAVTLPTPRIDEPFLASPWRSAVVVKTRRGKRLALVRLVDQQGNPLAGRRVIAVSSGRTMAHGTTDARGHVVLPVGTRSGVSIVDVTDNRLALTGPGESPRHREGL